MDLSAITLSTINQHPFTHRVSYVYLRQCASYNLSWMAEMGTAVLQIGGSLVRSQLVSLEFFVDIKSFRSHYGPGVDSASNRNEYQEYSLGVKAASA